MRLFAVLAVLPLLTAPRGESVALVDARIVVDPHTTIEKGTVVIRDGLIVAVGERAEIPAGAEIVKASGMTVYAGFIDGHAHVGLGDTKRTPDQRKTVEDEPFNYAKAPPLRMDAANRKGIRTELAVSDIVNVGTEDARQWMSAGFAAANIMIPEEYLAGPGALVSLSGAPRRASIVRPATLLQGGFRSYGDGYPSTLFGSMAHLRQVLYDARHYRELHEAYAANPSGKKRPPLDATLEGLRALLQGEASIAFEANSPDDIRRVFALADEFNLKVVITGGAEAHRMADELKRRNIPVIVSLKLPEEPKDPKHDPDYDILDRPGKLKDEEKREYEEYLNNARLLAEKGVLLCFSTLGSNPKDAWSNLKKLFERKLPADAALRALTVTPAELFGVSPQLGSIQVGKIANLTILTKPLGHKSAKVRYVFVDGKKFDLEEDVKGGRPEINLGGAWKMKLGDQELTLELKQKGPDVSGTAKLKSGDVDVKGTVAGKGFRLKAGELTLKGEMEDDQLSGTATGGGLESEFSASRPKKE